MAYPQPGYFIQRDWQPLGLRLRVTASHAWESELAEGCKIPCDNGPATILDGRSRAIL
jgi:hypothetical protein